MIKEYEMLKSDYWWIDVKCKPMKYTSDKDDLKEIGDDKAKSNWMKAK